MRSTFTYRDHILGWGKMPWANGPAGNFKPLVQILFFPWFDYQWSMVWGSSFKVELSLFES